MSLINHSDTWYFLDESGNVIESAVATPPANAASLLCAPGGSLDEGLAVTHGLTDAFADQDECEHLNPVTGEQLVMRGERAFAKKNFEPKNVDGSPAAREAKRALPQAGRIKPEAKAIVPAAHHGDAAVENKAVAGPTLKPTPAVTPAAKTDKVADKV